MKHVMFTAAVIGGILFGGSGVATAEDHLALFPFTGPNAEVNCKNTLDRQYSGQSAYCAPLRQADKNGFMMWGLYLTKRV